MRGYKAFNKGLICMDKQYRENTVFEEERADICESGMHFCKNPLNVLDYYNLVDGNCELSEFAEVEALDEVKTDDNEKFCTKKLKIGAKLDLNKFIKASFDFLYENAEKTSGNYSQVATSGYNSQVATSGYYSQVATSGDNSKVATSGDNSKVATSGDNSKVATSGNYSQVATSGYNSRVATSGNYSQVATSGYNSQVATSGYNSRVATSGDNSKVATSGNYSQVATSGYNSRVALYGDNNVGANIGVDGIIKGKIGSWITLAEYEYDNFGNYICVCVKSAKIDGVKLKENVFYKLIDGEFVEVK